jgi:hypothetical protein
LRKASAWNLFLYLIVISIVGVYAAFSAPVFVDKISRGRSFAHLEPEATSDSFLSVLGVSHPTSLIEQALRPFPDNQPLLFIGPDVEPFWGQTFFAISCLAYLRPVSAIRCSGPGKISDVINKVPVSSEIAGLIFFKVDPGRWAAGGKRVTPTLYIAPNRGARPWESYCP